MAVSLVKIFSATTSADSTPATLETEINDFLAGVESGTVTSISHSSCYTDKGGINYTVVLVYEYTPAP